MKEPKVWLVLGASLGLGVPAVRYLLAHQQQVITVDMTAQSLVTENLSRLVDHYAPFDFIINNSNYDLFSKNERDIRAEIETTKALLGGLRPYLRNQPPGVIINIPPQLCLATLSVQDAVAESQEAMNSFLTGLKAELLMLNCGLRFLEPGERLL